MPLDDLMPRGPIFTKLDEDRPTADYADRYIQRMGNCREAIRSEAVRSLKTSPEYPNVGKYMNYLNGIQRNPRLEAYRSKFCYNKMDKARYDNLALLTDTRPTIDVMSSVPDFQENAEVVGNIIRAEWTRQRMDLSLITIVDIAMLWGTAFAKNQATTPGNMSMLPCGPDQVFPIQPGWDIQSSSAILYRVWKNLAYFRSRYPLGCDGIDKEVSLTMNSGPGYNRPDTMDTFTWDRLSPQMRRQLGTSVVNQTDNRQMFGGIELNEIFIDDPSINESTKEVIIADPYLPLSAHNWWYRVKPGQRLYPRKRLVVYGGNKLVYDGPSPYWHGMYPFSCLRMRPRPDSFYGNSEYRNQIDIQDSINETAGGILDIQRRILNPVLITSEGRISKPAWDMFLQNKPGARLMVPGNVDPREVVHYAETPKIDGWIFDMLGQFLDPAFDKMAGILDTAALMKKEQTPGGDTIEQMRDVMQTQNRLRERYIESFLCDAGVQAVSNVCQFYTRAQRLKILGGDGITWSDFDYAPDNIVPASEAKESFWKNLSFNITPGSLRGDAKDREKLLAISLWNSKAIDLLTLHEKLEFTNPNQVVDRMMQQAQIQSGMAAQEQQQGEVPRLSREERNGGETV